MLLHQAEDGVQRADAKGMMIWDADPLVCRRFGLEYHVAPNLMHDSIVELVAQDVDESSTIEISRQLH